MKHSREDIVACGILLFRTKGYQGTGIQEILKFIGIPKGSFYNYFKTKEDFAIEAIEFYGKQGLERHKLALTDTSLTPLNRIIKKMKDTQDLYKSELFKKSCLLDMMALEISGTNVRVARVIDKIFEERKLIYANCIKEGQKTGEIRKDDTAINLADYLLAGYSGAQLKAKTAKSTDSLKNFMKLYINNIKTKKRG